jgi:hypothetical protein
LRGSITVLLILVGAVLTFPASLAVWEQRVIADRDGFVNLGQEIFEDQAVQDRLTEQIIEDTNTVLEANGLVITSSILTGLGRGQTELVTRAIVEELPQSVIGVQALDTAHVAVMAVIDDESQTVGVSGDDVFVNFRPVIERVTQTFETFLPGSRQVVLPEGIGEVVIVQEDDVSFAFQAARLVDGYAWFIAAFPFALFAAALVVAANRQMALLVIGISVIAAAGLRILIYEGPLRSIVIDNVVDEAGLRPAARGVYDAIAASIVAQEMLLIVAGLAMVVVSTVWWGLRRTGAGAV